MKPGQLHLPTIWRGADWPAIVFKWMDQNGNPINLTGYQAWVKTKDFNLNPVIVNAAQGITQLALSNGQTILLNLGTYSWDWVWENAVTHFVWPPMLAGKVEVKQATTHILH